MPKVEVPDDDRQVLIFVRFFVLTRRNQYAF
jgi:hypothetical protein